eukprot:gene12944-27313_t
MSKIPKYDHIPGAFSKDFLGNKHLSHDMYKFIVNCSKEYEQLFPSSNQLHKEEKIKDIVVSQRQALCLLSCAFLDILPYPSRTFDGQHLTLKGFNSIKQCQKALCLIIYFSKCRERILEDEMWCGSNIGFHRRSLENDALSTALSWQNSNSKLSHFEIKNGSTIETAAGHLQADFANKYIGGGVLRDGCVQEEIRFVISPECLISILLFDKMKDNEAILVHGPEMYSSYSGYARTFRCDSSYDDVTPMDAQGFKKTFLVAFDAIRYSQDSTLQYQETSILRDLRK